jgi:hypothetical protein
MLNYYDLKLYSSFESTGLMDLYRSIDKDRGLLFEMDRLFIGDCNYFEYASNNLVFLALYIKFYKLF